MGEELLQKAFAAALAARENAHAPYSRFKVGAAFVLNDGSVVAGCNVENSSFGATICAERNALCAAVAKSGMVNAQSLVLITDIVASPCGICLQVISDFCKGDLPIYLSTPKGLGKAKLLREFLPLPFGPEQLK
ncbi:MAG TPA: cytidine deaminase [Bdellovibrionota bacterium]|jgi:homotetrameric cytidine deaminase